MKVIVSDYDNTFYLHNINKVVNYFKVISNKRAINKFRKNGGMFIIATGRYYEAIYKEISKYGLEFDYLICNNGADIYDKNYNLVYLKKLSKEIVNTLKKINFELLKDRDKKNIVAAVNYNFSEETIEMIKKIDGVISECSFYKIKVIPKVDKLYAIKIILKDYQNAVVYTFGDGDNDKKMLNEYNGYTLNKYIVSNNIKLISSLSKKIRIIDKKNEY